jgi:hypothetical protein
MKALIFVGFVFVVAACGGSIPCAQAGGTCAAICSQNTAMACHADCGTAGVCCLPVVNGAANDCH